MGIPLVRNMCTDGPLLPQSIKHDPKWQNVSAHPGPSEVIFTSGATEGINTAIKSLAQVRSHPGCHIVTVQTEHSAITKAFQYMEQQGWRVTYLPVDPNGLLDLDCLKKSLTDDTALVSVMWANNETGVIQPIT